MENVIKSHNEEYIDLEKRFELLEDVYSKLKDKIYSDEDVTEGVYNISINVFKYCLLCKIHLLHFDLRCT